VQVGVKVEGFLNRQILVEAESLGHVTDFALDLIRIGSNVNIENLEFTRIHSHQAGG
jgi:hypothetical protein